jgi:hypothetical protein
MYTGMEVAVRWHGYEGERDYTHAKITHVAVGGGHTQLHNVRKCDDDGNFLPGATDWGVPARRIIMPWHDYKVKQGVWLSAKEEQDFKRSLIATVAASHLAEVEELCMLLNLVGIEAESQNETYRFNPLMDNSYGASIKIMNYPRFREMFEDTVKAEIQRSLTVPALSDEEVEEVDDGESEHL